MTELELIPPCNKCGHPRVRAKDGKIKCRTCEKAYRLANAEKIRLQIIRYHNENRDAIKIKNKNRYEKNKSEVLAKNKRYRDSHKEREREINRLKGLRLHPDYYVWRGMRARCSNLKNKDYARYGGRGISVCDRWQGSFQNFISDMGSRPSPNYSIERKDVNGNYEPSNCVWATSKEQAKNRRNSFSRKFNISEEELISLDGSVLTLRDLSLKTSIPLLIVKHRFAQHPNSEWILHSDYDNRYYKYRGHTYNKTELSLMSGVKYATLQRRLTVLGWTVEQSMTKV